MWRRVFRSSLLVLAVALAASCLMVMDDERGQSWPTASEFRRSVGFAAGGTVTVEHTLGNIAITGWDKNSVEVVATGRADEPAGRGRVRVYAAGDLEPSIDVREAGGSLRIRTRSLGGPWSSGGLDYDIRLPSSVNLDPIRLEKGDLSVADVYGRMTVELGAGSLKVSNFSGPLKALLESGRADVELLDVRSDDVIDITSQEGDITVRLQPDTNARIEAAAPLGEITSDYDLGLKLPAHSLASPLGSGEARIVLKALRGNIRILKAE